MSLDAVLESMERHTRRSACTKRRRGGVSNPEGMLMAALDAACAATGSEIPVDSKTTTRQVAAMVAAAVVRATERHSAGVDRSVARVTLLRTQLGSSRHTQERR